MLSTSTACSDSSAVLRRSLWQLTQYRVSSWRGSESMGVEADAACAGGDVVWAAPTKPASQTMATTISALDDTSLHSRECASAGTLRASPQMIGRGGNSCQRKPRSYPESGKRNDFART